MKTTQRRVTSVPSADMDLPQCSAADRVQWVERYRRSGQSQRIFAATHGLKLSRLRYWIYSPVPKVEGLSTAPRLQEVHLTGWPPPPHGWSAEIALPAGPTIRLDSALARELIVPLLRAQP